MLSAFGKVIRSVFVRILVVFLLSGFCTILIIGGFFHHVFESTQRDALVKSILQYVNYVAQDLGTPPSLERANEISAHSALQIRYSGPDGSWTTFEKVPMLKDIHDLQTWQHSPLIRGREDHGQFTLVVPRGKGVFVFVLLSEKVMQAQQWERWLFPLVFLLVAALFVTYLAIRRILRPLRHLTDGVRLIGEGHLDHQVQGGGSTEFDELADAFNAMTSRIRTMLHAREQLLLDVSHELRSPLTRMKVALEMLPDGRLREDMRNDIREMEIMVSEILEEARLRKASWELRCEDIPARSMLDEVVDLYRVQAPGVLVEHIPRDASIHGDAVLVKIALGNVISNAVKYSPADGEPVRVSLTQEEKFAKIRVRDRGEGIPAEDLRYIFEPFYRVDKSRSKRTGGYGLGLSLCRTIMEAHQGAIEVESALGSGTTITLVFPAQT